MIDSSYKLSHHAVYQLDQVNGLIKSDSSYISSAYLLPQVDIATPLRASSKPA